ncbi:MAG: CAP domain-containing protein [Deltaproteobacteria bacterium]|nr:CAP domain-containing protein [Deltaproteobacteria bacterium]
MPTLLLLVLACAGDSDDTVIVPAKVSVDDACTEDNFGDPGASEAALEAIYRANCYRNLLGLDLGVLNANLNTAAQAHADYMQQNKTLDHSEQAGKPGYTGDQVWDRAEAAGRALGAGESIGEVISQGSSPSEAVDGWVNSVYHRSPFTSPEWISAGFGQAGNYSSMTTLHAFPNSFEEAVIYPVHGQVDVPASFNSDQEFPDPAPNAGLVGPPITVTIASSDYRGGWNWFDAQLLSASLTGPDGEEALITLLPDDDQYLGTMIALLPERPLTPGATYTAKLSVTWAGGEADLTSVFTIAK